MNRIIDTGTVIKSYLDENEITITQLSDASDVSIKTIYRVLNNQSKLTYKVASGINKLIPEISIDFLMSYDAKYQVQIKNYEKETGIRNFDKLIDKFQLKRLFPEISNDKNALLEKGNKYFNFSSLEIENQLEGIVNYDIANNAKEFEKNIWLIAAYKDYCLNNEILNFDELKFKELLKNIIDYCGTTNKEMTIFNMKELCSMCGINFVYRNSIRNSRIKAAVIKDKQDKIYLFLSDLFRCVEGSWVSFIHELIHIKNRDYEKNSLLIEENRKDNEEFIENETFQFFISRNYIDGKEYNIKEITDLAYDNKIPIGIAAYLIRNRNGIYNDASINGMIHYY